MGRADSAAAVNGNASIEDADLQKALELSRQDAGITIMKNDKDTVTATPTSERDTQSKRRKVEITTTRTGEVLDLVDDDCNATSNAPTNLTKGIKDAQSTIDLT